MLLTILKAEDGSPEMNHCEAILKALIAAKRTTEASRLATSLGDKWVDLGDLPRAEADYKLAYDNSKVRSADYQRFKTDQNQRFFIRSDRHVVKTAKVQEEHKTGDSSSDTVRITAVVFRIKELIEQVKSKEGSLPQDQQTITQLLANASKILEKAFKYSCDQKCFESKRMILT